MPYGDNAKARAKDGLNATDPAVTVHVNGEPAGTSAEQEDTSDPPVAAVDDEQTTAPPALQVNVLTALGVSPTHAIYTHESVEAAGSVQEPDRVPEGQERRRGADDARTPLARGVKSASIELMLPDEPEDLHEYDS